MSNSCGDTWQIAAVGNNLIAEKQQLISTAQPPVFPPFEAQLTEDFKRNKQST